MPGVTNSQIRGIKEQNKQVNKVHYSNPLSAKLQHESVHGKKYLRVDNTKGDIRYMPKNLKPFGQF